MKKTKQGVRDLNNLKGSKPSNVQKLGYDARVQLEETTEDSLCDHFYTAEVDQGHLAVFGKKVYRDICVKCGVAKL